MPPRIGDEANVVTGLPRLCNFLLQADNSGFQELMQFFKALQQSQPAQMPPNLTASALALQYYAGKLDEKAAAAVATKLCQYIKALLAEQGGPFTKVQTALMAVVAAALARCTLRAWLPD